MRKRNKNSIVLLICSPGSLAHNKLEGKLGKRTWVRRRVTGGGLSFQPPPATGPPTPPPFNPRPEPGEWAEPREGTHPNLSSLSASLRPM